MPATAGKTHSLTGRKTPPDSNSVRGRDLGVIYGFTQ